MLISPKIRTTLSQWLGYKPSCYEPIYGDTTKVLKELDKDFCKKMYCRADPVCNTVDSLKKTVDELNTEVDHITHQKR